MKAKRFISLALCLIMAFMLCLPASAEVNASEAFALDAKDVPSGHWAREAIEMLNKHGIMLGHQGYFRPDDHITRAEFCALVNRAFGYFKKGEAPAFRDSGNDPDNWKDDAIMKASYQGYLKGSGGYAYPDRKITREEAFLILARVLRKDPSSSNTSFTDDGDISDWAKPLVAALWKEGYIRGSGGRLNPKDNITRAEVAQLLYNSIGDLFDKEGPYDMGNQVLGHVTISAAGVVLKNAIIKGNLYITEGVGDGTVTLENVTVEGQTVIAGGGVNSIIVINTSMGRVTIDVPDGASVRFAAQGSSTVDTVMVLSDSIIDNTGAEGSIESVVIALPEDATVELKGSFGTVEVEISSVTVNAENCAISQLIIASTALDTEINLDRTASVGSLVCDAQCQVLGDGRIDSAIINVNDVTLERRPANLTMPRGVTATVAGEELDKGYSESDTTGSTGGPQGPGTGGSGEEERTFTLRVAANPQGAATISGAGVYKPGTSVTIMATPIEGWGFRNWTVDGLIVGTNPKRLVYVMPERDVTVTVNLVPLYTLKVVASGGGDVTPKQPQKLAGTAVFTATATPKTGNVFSHWEIDGEIVSVEESITYFMPYDDMVLTAVFLPAGTTVTWLGDVSDTVPVSLKDGSYLISNGAQLAWIAQEVNNGNTFEGKKFTLQNNIDLSNRPWTPIGDLNHEFRGTFNGNGKTISNLNVAVNESSNNSLLAGLFGRIGKKGRVQKLKLDGVTVTAAYQNAYEEEDGNKFCYAGAIAGINEGEIKNCEVYIGTVRAENAKTVSAGGITGWNRQGAKITGCFNKAVVSTNEPKGDDAVSGGIAGQNHGTIESCFNEGVISAASEKGAHAGGITGYTYSCVITDCFNTALGVITADGNIHAAAGGIVGSCDAMSKISTCYSMGEITAEITNENGEAGTLKGAGGIVGIITTNSQSGYVRNCYYLDTTAQDGFGHIVGSVRAGDSAAAGFENQFTYQPFYNGFDFVKKWYFEPAGGYQYAHLREFQKTFKISVKAVPSRGDSAGGTAAVEEGYGERFMPGALVPLKAAANEGYYFLDWTVNGEIVSEQEKFTYMMPARNITINANFVAEVPETYALHLSVSPSGAGTVTGGGTYFAGETVTLKAQPYDENCHFEYWAEIIRGDTPEEDELQEIGTDAEMEYVMPARDAEVVAVFTQTVETDEGKELNYSSNPPEGGTVKVRTPVGMDMSGTIPGMIYEFIATPNEGYAFDYWTVNGNNRGAAPILPVAAPDDNINVVANFREIVTCTVKIQSSDPDMGIARVEGGGAIVPLREGTRVNLIASPNSGYIFTGWTIDGNLVSTENPYQYIVPSQTEVTVTANFVKIYTLTVTSADTNMGTACARFNYNDMTELSLLEGQQVRLVATPNTGYVFAEWKIGDVVLSSENYFSYTMPAQDVTITAHFTEWDEEVKYSLTLETNNSKRGEAFIEWTEPYMEGNSFPAGTRVFLDAEPYIGFKFEKWTIGEEELGTDSYLEYIMPAEDVTVKAHFKPLPPPEGVDTTLDYARYPIYDFAADGAGRYVGVGGAGSVIRSVDGGETWTQAWSGVNAMAVAYGNGKFIAINEHEVFMSEDGLHWKDITHLLHLGYGTDLKDITCGRFSEMGSDMFIITDGYNAYTSVDGEYWEKAEMNFSNGYAEALAFGEYRCVAVGLSAVGYTDDGITWHEVHIDTGASSYFRCYSVAYGNGKFVAGLGYNVLTSEDGISWSPITPTVLTNPLSIIDSAYTQYLSYADGIFFASEGNLYYISTDGVEYTWYSLDDMGMTSNANYAMGVGDIFAATGLYGQLLVSRDKCNTWEEAIPDTPYYVNDYFQDGAVQIFSGELLDYHSDFIRVSQGIVITSAGGSGLKRYMLIPYDPEWVQYEGRIFAASGNGDVYIAVGGVDYTRIYLEPDVYYRSVIYASTDAQAWYAAECSVPYMLKDIAYSPHAELFAAVGTGKTGGIILTSSDGRNWTEIYSVAEDTSLPKLNAISWDPNVGFIAGGEGEVIFVSADGENWTALEIDTGGKVTVIEGNVVAGNLVGVVITGPAGPDFVLYDFVAGDDENEFISAVTKDERGNIYAAVKNGGGVVSVYDESSLHDIALDYLGEIRKIIVTYDDGVGGQENRTIRLYTSCGASIFDEYLNCGCTTDVGGFAAGTGTETDPFIISSIEDLEHIKVHAAQGFNYRLNADITLPGQWTPIGDWYKAFNGKLDGNGHTINASAVIFSSGYEDYGLFGVIGESGEVRNLRINIGNRETPLVEGSYFYDIGMICGLNIGMIVNCEVTGRMPVRAFFFDEFSNYSSIGAIAGCNYGTITDCRVSGEIIVDIDKSGLITYEGISVGGIIGENRSTVAKCVNLAAITVSGYSGLDVAAGGITGCSWGYYDDYYEERFVTQISNCYNAGAISISGSSWMVGGIVGFVNEYIELTASYNVGTITVTLPEPETEPDPDLPRFTGGIAGYLDEFEEEGSISSCYYLDTGAELLGVGNKASDDPDNTISTVKLTDEQMRSPGSFGGFDFEYTWQFIEGDYPYPVLR